MQNQTFCSSLRDLYIRTLNTGLEGILIMFYILHFKDRCDPIVKQFRCVLTSSVSLVMEFQTNTLEKTLPTYYLFKRRKQFYEDLDEIEN